jgi:hypothetical protein
MLNSYLGESEEGDDFQKLKDRYKELGTLKVELWRETTGPVTAGTSAFFMENGAVIPEKALKGKPLDVATS